MSVTRRTDAFMAQQFGEDAFRVGGSVRDELLGRPGKDADYVVRGHSLSKVQGILSRARANPILMKDRAGHKLGFRARPRGLPEVEVVLPRTEAKKTTGAGNERHDFEIVLDPNLPLAEDALRRDFTFNAIYRNAKTGELVDPLDGADALANKVIEVTHTDSFRDDPLRILRALRFVATLGFTLEGHTRDTMAFHAPAMMGGLTDKGVSGTALDEFNKLLMGDNVANALRVARDTGALVQMLPELEPLIGFAQQNDHHDLTGDEHTFMALDAAARMHAPLRVRWALLFHDAGKPLVAWMGADGMLHFYAMPLKDEQRIVAEGGTVTAMQRRDHADVGAELLRKVLARLNADRKLRRDAPKIVERHMVALSMKVKPAKVRKWRTELGDDLLKDLLTHRLADCMGKKAVPYSDIEAIARMEAIREEAVLDGVPASAKDMKDMGLINGHDLIEMGIEPQKISDILAQILHEVVSQPSRMDRDWALLRAAKLGGKT